MYYIAGKIYDAAGIREGSGERRGTHLFRYNLATTFAGEGNVKAVAYDLRHHYAITNINSWSEDTFEFDDKLHYLSKSMGHRWIKSILYYYSIVPRLADTIKEKTENGFNKIVPEVG